MEEKETKRERINRVAREWYARNKERVRQRKLGQCHEYRRRQRVGRPTKAESHPDRVMLFNMESGEMKRIGTISVVETTATAGKVVEETKIETGGFFVSFK